MKIFYTIVALLTSFIFSQNISAYTGITSKTTACKYENGKKYDEQLEVKWSETVNGPVEVNNFIKLDNTIYYIVTELDIWDETKGYLLDKHYMYSYSCSSKKAKLLISSNSFDKAKKRIPTSINNSSLFEKPTIEYVNKSTYTIKFIPQNLWCWSGETEDKNYCDTSSIELTIDTKTKKMRLTHKFQDKPDELISRFSY